MTELLTALSDYGVAGIISGAFLLFFFRYFWMQTRSFMNAIEAKDKEISRVNDLRVEAAEEMATTLMANEAAMKELRRVVASLEIKIGKCEKE